MTTVRRWVGGSLVDGQVTDRAYDDAYRCSAREEETRQAATDELKIIKWKAVKSLDQDTRKARGKGGVRVPSSRGGSFGLRSLIDDVEAFSRLVGYTRNYYTHWDEELETKAAKDEELFRLTFTLKLIVEALLVLEVGFSQDEIEEILTRHPRFDQERRQFMQPPLGRAA